MPRKKYKMELLIEAPFTVVIKASVPVRDCYSLCDAEKKGLTKLKRHIKDSLGPLCRYVEVDMYADVGLDRVTTRIINKEEERC